MHVKANYCFLYILGNADFLEEREDLDIPIGSDIRKCSCIEILNDLLLEDSEMFEITATVNDPRLNITGETVATVVINDDNDSKLYVLTLFHCQASKVWEICM